MTHELAKQYRPEQVEQQIAQRWEAARAFHAEPASGGTPYSIVIPPPNVTAALHMGHALNNTLQDMLIRYHRMRGDNAMWMPGTDHAGIATQTVVEKRVLQEEGKKRTDFTRDQFIAKIQAWKDEYEQRITDQLKAMGCSCDWDRQRFTMDEQCARAVREAFFQLFRDGLIYRGKRLVNWDPVTQTALADDEVENEEIDGNFYYMRYPLAEGGSSPGEPSYVTVATTRPETMLGDTAVAVNPRDPQRAAYIGKHVILPIVGRRIPIIGDEHVVIPDPDSDDAKAKYASGFLKVTPAHDPNDWEIGQRHNLPAINVMAPDASISDKHGWDDASDECKPLIGLSREQARQWIVRWFKDRGLMEDIRPYRHSVGHSYRSHVPIEPYLSDQWYVKVTDDRLAGAALRAMAPHGHGGAGVPPAMDPKSQITTPTLTKTKRRLPHWQLGGSTYFVTFRLAEGALSEGERQLVLNACLHWHGKRADVYLVVVMPDHVHLLLTPRRKDEQNWYSLSDLLHSIKSFTAHELNKRRGTTGRIWQDESYDRIVRDEDEFHEKWEYIETNPVRAGLVERMEDYPFSAMGDSALRADGRRDARPTIEEDGRRDARPTENQDARPTGKPDWEGELRFYPERYANTYRGWLESLRDWCISRQLWWGHRIPVWHKRVLLTEENWVDELSGKAGLDDIIEGGWKTACVVIRRVSDGVVVDPKQDLMPVIATTQGEYDIYICAKTDAEMKEFEKHGYVQDPDVLDTWFSSALWPLSTMGWPDETPELKTWNPTDVLCTAREIITLWVSRMVMFNLYFRGCLPFRDVFIHAMIQDGFGQKMSKSLGNGVDPVDIIHSHGSDAMRFTLAQMTTQTQDVRLPVECVAPRSGRPFEPKYKTLPNGYRVAEAIQEYQGEKMVSSYGVASGEATPTADMPAARNTSEKFDYGRNFANKLWNATRFALTKLDARTPAKAGALGSLPDRWILSRVVQIIDRTTRALNEYDFHNYADDLYHFIWGDVCDWYIEAVKLTIEADPGQQQVLASVLDVSLRLLHPSMPFVTERLWEALSAAYPQRGVAGLELPAGDLLVRAAWPVADATLYDAEAVARFEAVREVVGVIRQVRTQQKTPPRQRVDCSFQGEAQCAATVQAHAALLENLANVHLVAAGPQVTPPAGAAVALLGPNKVFLHHLVDADAEKDRLARRLDELARSIQTLEGRLANEGYVSRAPAHLVQQTRDDLARAREEHTHLAEQLAAL